MSNNVKLLFTLALSAVVALVWWYISIYQHQIDPTTITVRKISVVDTVAKVRFETYVYHAAAQTNGGKPLEFRTLARWQHIVRQDHWYRYPNGSVVTDLHTVELLNAATRQVSWESAK